MEGFLLEKIKECSKLAGRYPVNRKYENYEIAAIHIDSLYKTNPKYSGEIYFIKKGNKEISTFVIYLYDIKDDKLIRKILRYIEKQESTVKINLNRRNIGIKELLCNRDVMKDLCFKIKPDPMSNGWLIHNGSFRFEISDKEFKEKLGWLFNNIKLSDSLFKDKDQAICNKIKELKTGIKTLQKEIDRNETQIENLEKSQLTFQDMQKTIKDYIGEDEWSAQKLLYEFTKGSFK